MAEEETARREEAEERAEAAQGRLAEAEVQLLVKAERQTRAARAAEEAQRVVEEARQAGAGGGRAVAADAWSGLARLARCAGVVLAARREGANSAATVLAKVAGFADLRDELKAGARSDSPAGGAGALGDACAAEEDEVRASRTELEKRQREVRQSAQLARAKEGPTSGKERPASVDQPGQICFWAMRTPELVFWCQATGPGTRYHRDF